MFLLIRSALALLKYERYNQVDAQQVGATRYFCFELWYTFPFLVRERSTWIDTHAHPLLLCFTKWSGEKPAVR